MTSQITNVLVLSSILFGFGVYMVIARRNAIGVLIGIELMLNSANLNIVAFNRYSEPCVGALDGQVLALFVMALAVAEAAVGLALIIALARRFGSVEPESADTLKG